MDRKRENICNFSQNDSQYDNKKNNKLIINIINVLTKLVAIIFAIFHIYTGIIGPYQGIIQRSIHVGGGLLLYLMIGLKRKEINKFKKLVDFVLLVIIIVSCSYVVINFQKIVKPMFHPNELEVILGLLTVACIFEIARRLIGWAIPFLSVLAFLYALFGPYMPGIWRHNGIRINYLIEVLFFSDRGIWGQVTGISATIIAIFIIFGTILFETGGGETFVNISNYIVGNSFGGAAKLATVASSLFGMISGSAGANVATTGAFTIPLMKKLGYDSDFAAGVECSASTGGQIMPPIMGAGAFIMAELLGISYFTIAKIAVIPSLLFYYGVFLAVDCEARKRKYQGIPKEEIPKLKTILHYSNFLPLVIPIVVLLLLFSQGFTPVTSGVYAIVSAILFYLATGVNDIKNRIIKLLDALEKSSQDMLTVISLIACAQILLCIISLTGIGVKFTNIIINIGQHNMILAGFFAMVGTMILGMGLPTVAAYLLAAAVMGPALSRLGVVPIAAHFFLFYYAIFAGLTPPVCGTVFIGSAIANSNWLKTAIFAIRLSIGAFIIPFMFLFSPALLFVGSTTEIFRSVITSFIGVTALSIGGIGYLFKNLSLIERALLYAIGILLVVPTFVTDIIGIFGFIITIVYIYITTNKS